jgi:NADH-quinone oxidoreductase subunit G
MDGEIVHIILNGKEVEARHGERIVDVINRNGIFFAAPCYHKYLSESGHCGMCLVGARRNPTDAFTVVFSCTATAKDRMEIDTECGEAAAKRDELFELCLAQHPLDCAKCDKVGRCFLYRFSRRAKFRGFTRIVGGKLPDVTYKTFGKNIVFDPQKCIGCKRCIRFCRDIIGDEALGFIRTEAGYKEIDVYPNRTIDNNYSLNLVDLCPAGAFINTDCVFQPTEWDLISTPSISTESSSGVNTYVLHSEDKIFRIIPRENEHVNGAWMPDSARNEHKYFDNRKRLTKIMQNGVPARQEMAIMQIIGALQSGEIAIVCSGNMSMEDQFLLRRLLDSIVSDVFFLKKSRQPDGFLIADDATPNCSGAILNGIIGKENVVEDLSSLNRKINSGQCKKILSLNEEIFSHGVSYAIPEDVEIFYIGTEDEKTSKRAVVSIPTATHFEQTGTFVNRDYRLQKFHVAISPPNDNIFPMWYVLSLLLMAHSGAKKNEFLWLDDVWHSMSKCMDALENVDLFNLDPKGIELKRD